MLNQEQRQHCADTLYTADTTRKLIEQPSKTYAGIDCSGLVQISLAACGISAPRDSDMLARETGGPLDIGEDLAGLQRGDLLFWKGHVGIMRDAHRLLHANGHHMLVSSEPLREARDRIRDKSFGAIIAFRRLET